ncbi:TPA: hypothetical protein DCR49_03700 [Candidatus Delongbacteria bacterium]|nr:MAG: hypothetical protein A2Y40_06005 [Candidatus Margulisbacteria bacterium GWF2_35_9]HAQ61092.1 hypothetical protein [Candidatus Delongbacteria bacterium]
MYYLITGAAASGKTTMVRNLIEKLPHIECHDSDEILVMDEKERCEALETWIGRAVKAQEEGKDFLLVAHSPLGEFLASPSVIKLDGISACLLDCNDFVRTARYRSRPQMEEWPLNQDTLCWAVWQRMHAIEPEWEQHVIVKPEQTDYKWDRWTNWTKGDKRWDVKIIDSSYLAQEETLKILIDWVNAKKKEKNYLTIESKWWEK